MCSSVIFFTYRFPFSWPHFNISRQISLPSLPTLFFEYLAKFHSHLANTQAGDGYDSDGHEDRTKNLHDLLEDKKNLHQLICDRDSCLVV